MEKKKEQLDKSEEIKELSEDDLGKVSGGKEYNTGEQIESPYKNVCKYFVCKFCGNKTYKSRTAIVGYIALCEKCGLTAVCHNCAFSSESGGYFYCIEEHKKKK